jgi:uncharacterized protein (DUF3084 family)
MDTRTDMEAAARNLVAENARLRGEVERLTEWSTLLHHDRDILTADLARVTEELASRTTGLKLVREDAYKAQTDLARVTGERDKSDRLVEELAHELVRVKHERDALLAAAKDVLACDKALSDARAWNEGHLDEVMLAELLMVQSFAPLHLAVAACAPPASGEGE